MNNSIWFLEKIVIVSWFALLFLLERTRSNISLDFCCTCQNDNSRQESLKTRIIITISIASY